MTTARKSASLARRALFIVLSALASGGCGPKAPPPPPAPDVLVTEVKQEDVPIVDEFVGTLDGSVNASIQARVQGYLTSQNYKEGTEVKKGDLLFQIDPRPFEAALAQAKAALLGIFLIPVMFYLIERFAANRKQRASSGLPAGESPTPIET